MEAFYNFVRRVVDCFKAAGLDYMLTGALAASFYGVPRTTLDADVLIKLATRGDRAKLVSALKQACLEVEGKKIEAALKPSFRIATFKDSKSPYSVDVIFSREKTLKKRVGTIAGMPTFYQTPEDLILAKLHMIKATVPRERDQKDEDDVRAILRFTKVDVEAVKTQARKSNTLQILESIQPKG